MSINNSSDIIKTIYKELENLETAFYNIDNGLIQHPDLCKFSFHMENIIENIRLQLTNIKSSNSFNETDDKLNINFSQLRNLRNSSSK